MGCGSIIMVYIGLDQLEGHEVLWQTLVRF